MTWVSWRLQRTEMLIVVGIFALLAAFLLPTGLQMAHAYSHAGLGGCLSFSPDPSCMNALGGFRQRFQSVLDLATWFTLVPGLVGVLLAAPFILDLERGTYRLAWTQSITRGRWLLGKLGLSVAAAALTAGGLSLLFAWWRAPSVNIDGRLANGNYDVTGIVVFGYTLFALGLALALGAVWRRSGASLIVAFVVYLAVRVLFDQSLRDHLVAPLTATFRGAEQLQVLYHARIVHLTGTLHGRHVMDGSGFFLGGGDRIAAPGIRGTLFHVVYQPDGHFWPLQLAETGIFLGLAAALTLFAAWWTSARAA